MNTYYFRAPYMAHAMTVQAPNMKAARKAAANRLCHARLPRGTTINLAEPVRVAPLSDAALLRMDVDAMNSGLSNARPDLRYTRADAERFASLWNARKLSTVATTASGPRFSVVCILDGAP